MLKKYCEDKHKDLLLRGQKAKGTTFLSKYLIHSYFKFNGKQKIKIPKKLSTLDSKIMKEK